MMKVYPSVIPTITIVLEPDEAQKLYMRLTGTQDPLMEGIRDGLKRELDALEDRNKKE
jgi:hypothetical protein